MQRRKESILVRSSRQNLATSNQSSRANKIGKGQAEGTRNRMRITLDYLAKDLGKRVSKYVGQLMRDWRTDLLVSEGIRWLAMTGLRTKTSCIQCKIWLVIKVNVYSMYCILDSSIQVDQITLLAHDRHQLLSVHCLSSSSCWTA